MFVASDKFQYKYTPILAVSKAEMDALEQLPDKSKDILLPIIPLRGWLSSKELESTIKRIEKAIGDRYCITDIDESFVQEGASKRSENGDFPRQVFGEVKELLKSDNGYENWTNFIRDNENFIPVIQTRDLKQLRDQIKNLDSLGRGIVVRFNTEDISTETHIEVLKIASELDVTSLMVVYDYGQVNREVLTFSAAISSIVKLTNSITPGALVAISCSSFPSSFSGYNSSENSIYERLLYNSVRKSCPDVWMIYSDRGSARADKIGGGGGIPSPRIDYPLPNDWRFIREEYENSKNPYKGEKKILYTRIATRIMAEDYWNPDLRVWGTQIIEFTSKGDEFGINSPMKATAVRINIHLHQQLYYDTPIELEDTDEDWED